LKWQDCERGSSLLSDEEATTSLLFTFPLKHLELFFGHKVQVNSSMVFLLVLVKVVTINLVVCWRFCPELLRASFCIQLCCSKVVK
jgi:hypothetical protein